MSEDYAEAGPILVYPDSKTRQEAETNLFAFSNEARQQNATLDSSEMLPVTEIPRMRQCYGWMQFSGQEFLRHLLKKLLPMYNSRCWISCGASVPVTF